MTRTAILVRCSTEEAEMIRKTAQLERRTISGFVLNAVMNRIHNRDRVLASLPGSAPRRSPEPDTAPQHISREKA